MPGKNRYHQLIESVFFRHFKKGSRGFDFRRDELEELAAGLGIRLPKNLGDLVYTFRYRGKLPESVQSTLPAGDEWIILPAGRGRYRFKATTVSVIEPRLDMAETKIPDATPGVIAKYALSDEQALLAKLRYNRLLDIFTGVTCYSLQNHLRSTVTGMGQVETDEIYVGLDKKGVHYILPVQAKGGRDKVNIVQIIQDYALCREKFPQLVCRPVGAQFMKDEVIALFEFEETARGFGVVTEKHYRLVPHESVTDADLATYLRRAP